MIKTIRGDFFLRAEKEEIMEKESLENQAKRLAGIYFSAEEQSVLAGLSYRWNGRFHGKTAGICRFKRTADSKTIPVQIEISSKYMEIFPEMLNSVLLHEMIHAVLPWEEKHGVKFKKRMAQINHTLEEEGKPLIAVRIPEEKAFPKDYKYTYVCTRCGQLYRRVQKPIDLRRNVCGRCRGKLQKVSLTP